jgi:hypothetical protein
VTGRAAFIIYASRPLGHEQRRKLGGGRRDYFHEVPDHASVGFVEDVGDGQGRGGSSIVERAALAGEEAGGEEAARRKTTRTKAARGPRPGRRGEMARTTRVGGAGDGE